MQKVVGCIAPAGWGKDTLVGYLAQFGFERIAFADPLYKEVATAFGVTPEFLGNRETKEKPLARLSLQNCMDKNFVAVAVKYLDKAVSKKIARQAGEFARTGKIPVNCSSRQIKKVIKQARSPRRILQVWGTEYRRQSQFGYDNYWLEKAHQVIKENPNQDFAFSDCRFTNEANFIEEIGGVLVRIVRPALKDSLVVSHSSEVELLNRNTKFVAINEEGNPNSLLSAAEQIILAMENEEIAQVA